MQSVASKILAGTRAERRAARRSAGHGDVWLVNHYGRTVLRCACIDVSLTGMRLHVPPGYGIAPAQRYEFSGQIAGESAAPEVHTCGGRWGTIVWSRHCREHGAPFVDIGVALEALHAPLVACCATSKSN